MPPVDNDVQQVSDAIDRIRRLTARMGARLQAEVGLNVTQATALHFIAEGAIRVRDVADSLQQHVSTASRLVDGLVRDELITRTEDPEDRRAVVLELTDAGVAKLAQVVKFRQAWVGAALSELSAQERRTFAELAERFAAGAEVAFADVDGAAD